MATTDLLPTELPPSVRLVAGDLDRLVVESPASTAEIYLQGAHVASWAPLDQAQVLFMSGKSRFEAGAPIRGGVPICFPWFGPGRTKDKQPAHGFARLLPWSVVDVVEEGDTVTVVLRLTDEGARDFAWPHRFEALFRVSVGQALTLALEVRNTGPEPFSFEEALHTYFAVSDVGAISVAGLEAADYVDTLADGAIRSEDAPVRFTGPADRIYPGTDSALVIEDPGHGRRIRNVKERSRSTVVWNPEVEKSAALEDFGNEEWHAMVCVETANVRADAVELAPGESHTMTAEISVEALDAAP